MRHGGGNFDIILSLLTLQVNLKFHGGGNFDIILSLRTVQVNVKFHGGGNFDIISSSVDSPSQFEVPWRWEF